MTTNKGHCQISPQNTEVSTKIIQLSDHRTKCSQVLGYVLLIHQRQALHKCRTCMQFDTCLHRSIQNAVHKHSLVKNAKRNLQKIHGMGIYGRNSFLGLINREPNLAHPSRFAKRNHCSHNSFIFNCGWHMANIRIKIFNTHLRQ